MSDVFIMVCVNRRCGTDQPSCVSLGALDVLAALQAGAAGRGLIVETCYCFGHCRDGPVVRIGPGGPFYKGVTVADVPGLLDAAEKFAA